MTQAANQLPVRTDIDESPGTVFLVHGVLVGLPEKPYPVGLLDQIVDLGGILSKLAKIEADGALVLPAAPHCFRFALAPALGKKIGRGHGGKNQNGDRKSTRLNSS